MRLFDGSISTRGKNCLIFSFSRSGNEANRSAEFRHSLRHGSVLTISSQVPSAYHVMCGIQRVVKKIFSLVRIGRQMTELSSATYNPQLVRL